MTLILAIAMISNVVTQGMAHASAPHGSIFEMVICAADGGESVILVDADGNRIDPEEHCPHDSCPDCLMSGAHALIGVSVAFRPEARFTDTSGAVAFPFVLQRRSGLPTARGPPQKV